MSNQNDNSSNSKEEQSQQPQVQPQQQSQQPPQSTPQYGYQQPPQPTYGYPQQPQPIYGYQQPTYGYQQPPQPTYGYAQPPYVQPQAPVTPPPVAPIPVAPPVQPASSAYSAPRPQPAAVVVTPASPAEKDAAFSAASTIFMLILCIVGTVNLVTGFIGKIVSFNIGGILLYVLEILIVVGMWITYLNAKKQKLSSKGISLIRIPYVIQFVFSVITFIVNIVTWIFTFNIVSLIFGILTFIFQCICFGSVNKTLKMARDINMDKSVVGKKAGSFAAIVMIIYAVLDLISEIIGFAMLEAIKAMLEEVGAPEILTTLLGSGGAIVIVVAIVAFLVSISGAIVMLQFGKKVKQANSRA